jgi:hypothetical protein
MGGRRKTGEARDGRLGERVDREAPPVDAARRKNLAGVMRGPPAFAPIGDSRYFFSPLQSRAVAHVRKGLTNFIDKLNFSFTG